VLFIRSQFYQHFTCSFCADILLLKNYKTKPVIRVNHLCIKKLLILVLVNLTSKINFINILCTGFAPVELHWFYWHIVFSTDDKSWVLFLVVCTEKVGPKFVCETEKHFCTKLLAPVHLLFLLTTGLMKLTPWVYFTNQYVEFIMSPA